MKRSMAFLLVTALWCAAVASADVVMEDPFELPLDEEVWQIDNASLGEDGVATSEVAGGNLTVTALTYVHPQPATSAFPTITFTHALEETVAGDFDALATVGWDAAGAPNEKHPIQYGHLRLLDEEGNVIAAVGYSDGHIGGPGRASAQMGDEKVVAKEGQPAAGTSVVSIVRRDGKLSARWGETEVLAGESDAAVAKVQLEVRGFYFGKQKENLYNKIFFEDVSLRLPD